MALKFLEYKISSKGKKMISHLKILSKIFILFEITLAFCVVIIWGFFDLLSYIKDGTLHLDILYTGLKTIILCSLFISLVFWLAYYLWPIFKNRNTF